MALLLPGKTVCSICGKPILASSEATEFPAFLRSGHPLGRFSDAAFHTTCFANCAERQQVEAAFAKYQQIWKSRPLDLKSLEEIEALGKEAFRDL